MHELKVKCFHDPTQICFCFELKVDSKAQRNVSTLVQFSKDSLRTIFYALLVSSSIRGSYVMEIVSFEESFKVVPTCV